MKKLLHIAVLLLLLLALVPAVVLAHTEGGPFVTELIADGGEGDGIEVGEVLVWNDGDNLYVKYVITDPDWCITETHLHVATSLAEIPQKNGNPPPGKFDYKGEHDCVSEVFYTYDLAVRGWGIDTDLTIAAHAVVIDIRSGARDSYVDEVVAFTRINGNFFNTSGDNGDDGSDTLGAPAIDPNTPATCTIISGDPNGCWTSPGYVPGQYDETGGIFVEDAFGQLDNAFCNAVPINPERCPQAGHLTVKFNNICEFSPDPSQPSLFVWEVGGKTEGFLVEVFSGDTKLDEFVSVATTQTNGDVPIFFGQTTGTFNTVKLTSTDNGGGDPLAPNTSGPDFDAVECLNPVYREETAWGAGLDFPGKNWATYFEYTVQAVCPAITGTEGDITVLDSPLSDVQQDTSTSDTPQVFAEYAGTDHGGFKLDIDYLNATNVVPPPNDGFLVDAETPVCSYYVHYDDGDYDPPYNTAQGSITFESNVLGLIVAGTINTSDIFYKQGINTLCDTNSILGNDDTTYADSTDCGIGGEANGLEIFHTAPTVPRPTNQDPVSISGDTVNFDLLIANKHDAFRIILLALP